MPNQPLSDLEPPATTARRVYFLDNLRIGLIVLVVLHHVAMAYGAAGLGFYYVELHPDGFSRGLLIFVLGNQAWFMGAFFLIAGYFTPGSFDRKGAARFLSGRLVRLGIPLALYAALLNPLSTLGWFYVPEYLGPLDWDTFEYLDSVRMGPMWFVAMLLIFSIGYATWRIAALRLIAAVKPKTPGYPAIGGLVLDTLGRLPQTGEIIEVHGIALRVTQMRRNWIAQVAVPKASVVPPASDEDPETEEAEPEERSS